MSTHTIGTANQVSASAGPIGTGWTEFSPPSVLQVETNEEIHEVPGDTTSITNGGGRYTNSGGVETFELVNNESTRVERRYRDDYSSGRRQFQADITFFAPSHQESVHQIFNGPKGPWLLMPVESTGGGSIRLGGGTHSDLLATGLYRKSFRLNTLNDISGDTQVYIDGILKTTVKHPGGTFYTKYGCYGSSKTAPAKIEFRNVRMFK
jgi:hypothetical protein